MALIDKVPEILEYIESNQKFTDHNKDLYEIFEGDLFKFVDRLIQKTVAPTYYEQIRERIDPINILRRVIDKLSKVYVDPPRRKAMSLQNESDAQELLEMYEAWYKIDENMNYADEYLNLHKGYSLEPFYHIDRPKLRTLPFDRFLPKTEDMVDPTELDIFIKFLGKKRVIKAGPRGGKSKEKFVDVFFVFNREEFIAIDSDGDIFEDAMIETDGENPFGVIPFVYKGYNRLEILPKPDTDVFRMAVGLPAMISDLNGVALFQAFSIVYGINLNAENITMSPNSFLNFKSDAVSDAAPQIGTIKPEADITEVLQFLMSKFSLWLETKNVRVGSVGNMDAGNVANGISKIIDEMDTFEAKKTNMKIHASAEAELWEKTVIMHNYWVDNGILQGVKRFPEDTIVEIDYPELQPMVDREKMVRTAIMEIQGGLKDQETAIRELNPNWPEENIEEMLERLDLNQGDESGRDESQGRDQESDESGDAEEN